MSPSIPDVQPLPPCPRCGNEVGSIEMHAGVMERGLNGTRFGTDPDRPPETLIPEGPTRRLEPFPAYDKHIVKPCGHEVTGPDASALLFS